MSFFSSIAHKLRITKARASLPVAERGAFVPDLALWNQGARIGGGITPSQITSIIRSADAGEMRRLMDLANECRQRDTHLQAVLSTSEETIASLPWQLVAPDGDDERAKDRRAREWVEGVLRAIPNFPILLGHLAGAVFYSYAVSETLWRKEDGRLVPYDFRPLAHRRFGFRIADGTFVWRDEGTAYDGIDFRTEHPHKFVVSQPRVTGDVKNREGLCRSLVWMSVMRNWSIGDWLKTAEVSWKPWRIGEYEKNGSSTEDKDALEDVLRRLTTDGAAVIPKTSNIRIEWPGGTSNQSRTHGELVNVLGMEMSKCVLGQTETTQSSSSSGYAQAKIHNDVRKDLRDARARQVATDITRDIVASMVALNFGKDVAVPQFVFITQDPVDLKAFGEALKLCVGVGMPIPTGWACDQAGVPERKGDEPILIGASSFAVTSVPKPGEEPDDGEPEDDPEIPIDEGEPEDDDEADKTA